MKIVRYVSLEVVLAIHDSMVEEYGGSHGIRDLPLLESALARPQASFGGEELYVSIHDKAAALFHYLLLNPPFVAGNKQTAITTTARFLAMNGYELTANDDQFVAFPLRIENNHLSIEEITQWLLAHATTKTS